MQGTVIERALVALKKHGQLSLDELAKHTGTTKSTLYSVTGTLVKLHGVRKVAGKRGTFEMGGKPSVEPAASATPKNGSPYAGALADLRSKRAALSLDIEKLDVAIAAIEALG